MKTDSYIQWYNENEGRAYPISESATRLDISGNRLPDDIIVDMGVMVPPIHENLYISSIRITSQYVAVGLSSSVSGLLLGTYLRSDINPYTAYPLTPVVPNVSGWIAFGSHRAVTTESYRFSNYSQSGLELRVVKPLDPMPVRRLLRYGGDVDQYVDGTVKLLKGASIDIVKETDTVVIKLTAGTEQIFVSPCANPATEDVCGTPPIRRINGVCPDANGRITLRFE